MMLPIVHSQVVHMLIYVYLHCMFLKGMVSTGFRLDQSHTSQNKVKYWNVVLSRFCWWMQLMYGKSTVYLKNALVSVLQMMAYLWFHINNIVFHDTPATTLSSIHHWCERTAEVGWQSGYVPRSKCGKSTKLKIINHFYCLNWLDKYVNWYQGGAFIFAFPIGGILGSKCGIFVTPESNQNKSKKLDLREANAFGGLLKLFGHENILRTAAMAYFFCSLARCSLDAQFTNYANIRFGWSQVRLALTYLVVTSYKHSHHRHLYSIYYTGSSRTCTRIGWAYACNCTPTLHSLLWIRKGNPDWNSLLCCWTLWSWTCPYTCRFYI